MKQQKDVLIVEDENNIACLLRVQFEMAGLTVDNVGDGKEALLMLESTEYKVISLDMGLPIMSGLEFLHNIPLEMHKKIVVFSSLDYPMLETYELKTVCDKPKDGIKYHQTIMKMAKQ